MVSHRNSLSSGQGAAAGFTLVEVLVAVLLSAVIFASAYEVIGSLVQYQLRMNARHKLTSDALLLKNLFGQLVEKSLHSSDLPHRRGNDVFFSGQSDSLRLVSRAYSRNFDEPGFRVYRVFLRDGEVIVSHFRYGEPKQTRVVRETPSGLEADALELFYWSDNGWETVWQDEQQLPRFIRVRLHLPDGRWVELVRETALR